MIPQIIQLGKTKKAIDELDAQKANLRRILSSKKDLMRIEEEKIFDLLHNLEITKLCVPDAVLITWALRAARITRRELKSDIKDLQTALHHFDAPYTSFDSAMSKRVTQQENLINEINLRGRKNINRLRKEKEKKQS